MFTQQPPDLGISHRLFASAATLFIWKAFRFIMESAAGKKPDAVGNKCGSLMRLVETLCCVMALWRIVIFTGQMIVWGRKWWWAVRSVSDLIMFQELSLFWWCFYILLFIFIVIIIIIIIIIPCNYLLNILVIYYIILYYIIL